MPDLKSVEDAFRNAYSGWDENAKVEVQPGSADYLHVVVTSPAFEGRSMASRNEPARAALRALGPATALRITVLMLVTPTERRELEDARSMAV